MAWIQATYTDTKNQEVEMPLGMIWRLSLWLGRSMSWAGGCVRLRLGPSRRRVALIQILLGLLNLRSLSLRRRGNRGRRHSRRGRRRRQPALSRKVRCRPKVRTHGLRDCRLMLMRCDLRRDELHGGLLCGMEVVYGIGIDTGQRGGLKGRGRCATIVWSSGCLQG